MSCGCDSVVYRVGVKQRELVLLLGKFPLFERPTYAKDFSLTCNYVIEKSGTEVCVALIFANVKRANCNWKTYSI